MSRIGNNIPKQMPEEISGRKIFSLYEVTRSIQKTIAERYKSTYWIKAEMNKLNFYRQSGHCYPELVEKHEGKVIAQIRCNLWKDDYLRINSIFQRVLNEPLKDGIKILFQSTISFHPEHGLTLRIIDIDPNFTLGDLEREKQETIKKLREGGIYEKNKALKLALLPKRIAIISVETSKGYADFLSVLEAAEGSWRYKFFHLLFPSLLQGDKAVPAIIYQLRRIRKVVHHFDVVAIIRGGGGDIGLSCYNDYKLAREIALFPIPVITGIGHATNETIVEMIAYENAITPTKLAEFVIQKFHDFSIPVRNAEEKIIDKSRKLLADQRSRFQSELKLFRSVTQNVLMTKDGYLKANSLALFRQSQFAFRNEKANLDRTNRAIGKGVINFCSLTRQRLTQLGHVIKKDTVSQLKYVSTLLNQYAKQILTGSKVLFRSNSAELNNLEKNVSNMSPDNVLKRGYSITLLNGKALTSFQSVNKGDILKTILNEGEIHSTANHTSKTKDL
jgi:exodeoxyribonuclease VII large subunit